jgi:hypothetical protein
MDRLISETFSLWFKSPNKRAKSHPEHICFSAKDSEESLGTFICRCEPSKKNFLRLSHLYHLEKTYLVTPTSIFLTEGKKFESQNAGSQLENRNQVCACQLKTRSRTIVLYKAIYALGGSSCAVLALNGRPYWGAMPIIR